jgi:AcrR family transcriptional regulator
VTPRTPTRERILNAAERIHSKHGLSELTLRRVAKAVRVTPMAIYKHFEDKNALLDGLADRGFGIWERYLEVAVTKRTPMMRLRAVLDQLREFALEHPRYFELMFLAKRGPIPNAPASLRETPSPSMTGVIADVRGMIEAGELRRGDPGETILLMWATAHGLISLHFTGRFGGDASAFRAIYDRTMDTQLRLLRA